MCLASNEIFMKMFGNKNKLKISKKKIFRLNKKTKFTPRLAIASLSNCTTSSPTTPEQLNPLVHLTSKPLVSPSCNSGKENVNPSGSLSAYTLCS